MGYSVFMSVLDGVKPSCPVLDGHRPEKPRFGGC